MGGVRGELVGYNPARLAHLKALGCYSEIIAWKTRLFVPVNDLAVLEKLLAEHGVGPTRGGA